MLNGLMICTQSQNESVMISGNTYQFEDGQFITECGSVSCIYRNIKDFHKRNNTTQMGDTKITFVIEKAIHN